MVSGHLREQNGMFQMVLTWKDSSGKRRSKSLSTGLAVKGNKKRGEKMLLKARSEFNPDNYMPSTGMLFTDFLEKWLGDKVADISPDEYSDYIYYVRTNIVPYFSRHNADIKEITDEKLIAYFDNERNANGIGNKALLSINRTISIALDYAISIGWRTDNPACNINPCLVNTTPFFTSFLRDWLKMMKTQVAVTTYSAYANVMLNRIIPYFDEHHPSIRLNAITAKHIQDYYTYEMEVNHVSANTVKHRHANIHKALSYAYKTDMIQTNPADKVELPKVEKYSGNVYNKKQLEELFQAIKGDPAEFGVVTAAFYGLRRSEVVGLKWDAVDFEKKTITIKHTIQQTKVDGKLQIVPCDRTKTKSSCRTLPLVAPYEAILLKMRENQKENRKLCGSCYCTDYLDYIYVNEIGEIIKPDYLTTHFKAFLEEHNMPHIRFHDLRHPYVKHTTKIFSLRLMDFQAQAYPDARRKTRGACQLLRVGQSRSPVRPLCNRKRFSCLPPQSKMSWILYAISMRLSGYTSTRSISSSASSVVSVSASKIALDASLRLSCRACSSCFCFACANTAA